jgi:hypothetical protein
MTVVPIEALHPVLERCLFTGQTGPMINHPYLVRPYVKRFNAIFNRQYLHQRREIQQAKIAGNWAQVVWLHEQSYRPLALYQIGPRMTDEQFWRMVSEVWTDSQDKSQNYRIWRRIWLTERPRREQVMTQTEHRELSRSPDPLTLYLGCQDAPTIQGLSWTTSRRQALQAANRFLRDGGTPLLVTTRVAKKSVQAYFDQGEVVVLPEHLGAMTSFEVHPMLGKVA